jgi:hypothetical protein
MKYFSEREGAPAPRTKLEIDRSTWGGLYALIEGYIVNSGFGIDFPVECPDGRGTIGTDRDLFGLALKGEVPGVAWPLTSESIPPTLALLDLLEFCAQHVATATSTGYHSYYGHQHVVFDREEGRREFIEKANRILGRNQIAFELHEDGTVGRLVAPVFDVILPASTFKTGDGTLDQLLETARKKFLDPDPAVRREALEKLWDAWERLKTLEPGKDKKGSTQVLLNKATNEPKLRQRLEDEARALTDIGNEFMIRHAELDKVDLRRDEHVDYLFHRLFSLIWLLLCLR